MKCFRTSVAVNLPGENPPEGGEPRPQQIVIEASHQVTPPCDAVIRGDELLEG